MYESDKLVGVSHREAIKWIEEEELWDEVVDLEVQKPIDNGRPIVYNIIRGGEADDSDPRRRCDFLSCSYISGRRNTLAR